MNQTLSVIHGISLSPKTLVASAEALTANGGFKSDAINVPWLWKVHSPNSELVASLKYI